MYSIEMENGMSPEEIALICLKAVHVVEGGLDVEEQIGFLQFRHYLTLLQRAADDSKTNREINQRFSVTSAGRIVHLIASHGGKKTRAARAGQEESLNNPPISCPDRKSAIEVQTETNPCGKNPGSQPNAFESPVESLRRRELMAPPLTGEE
jgi:hypothetical protein